MDNWDEIKIAYIVSAEGTVAAASERLGVHRATVIRHIDALEERLGEKIFERLKTGYTPTHAGKQLFNVAKITEEQFCDVSRRIRGKGSYIRGELVFTTIDTLAPIILPAVANFHREYSRIKTIFVSTEQLLTLTYGETHLALWPGLEPEIFNTISIECGFLRFGLFASGKYIQQYGVPKSIKDFKDHYFVCHNDQSKSHLRKWEQENIPPSRIALAAGTPSILHEGVLNGIGIGFVDLVVSKRHPSLVEVLAPKKDRWEVPLRLIIHKDVYNSDKIQAFLKMVEMSNQLKT